MQVHEAHSEIKASMESLASVCKGGSNGLHWIVLKPDAEAVDKWGAKVLVQYVDTDNMENNAASVTRSQQRLEHHMTGWKDLFPPETTT